MIDAKLRVDDGRVVISTTNYVSHQKAKGAWVSSFSLTKEQATLLRALLEDLE